MRICFITSNQFKLREAKSILGNDIDTEYIDLEEIQGSVAEVTSHKLKRCKGLSDKYDAILVEDSGLEIKSLGGLPGAYIKFFVDSIGCEGIIKMLNSFTDRTATSVCVFGLIYRGQHSIHEGRVEGEIVDGSPRYSSKSNFGWDPVFRPKSSHLTYAEMNGDEKNRDSARVMALMSVLEELNKK